MSTSSICNGCLAFDRTLKPVTTNNMELLNLLLKRKKELPNKSRINVLFCWECSSFLNKLSHFQYKVNMSQQVLKEMSKTEDVKYKPFSNIYLTPVKNGYDIIITDSGDAIIDNEDQKPLDCEIKSESDDTESNYDAMYDSFQHDNLENVDSHINSNTEDEHVSNVNFIEVFKTNLIKDKEETHIKVETDDANVKDELIEEMKTSIDVVKKRKTTKGLPQKRKFIILRNNAIQGDVMQYVEIKKTNYAQVRKWFDKIRVSEQFKAMRYKCIYCLKRFGTEKAYLQHKASTHSDDGDTFICDICDRGFIKKNGIRFHLRHHKYKYTCKLCDEDVYLKSRMRLHLMKHTTRFQCRICWMEFEWQRDFYEHYNALHKFYTCDYCGCNRPSKKSLERHILDHTTKYCKICDVKFGSFRTYKLHYEMKHLKTEDDSAYCVECDIKFMNKNQYRYHLRTAVKHVRKPTNEKYPCPACKRVYAKKLTMKYHYQHYHLKTSKFYCEKCDKYMLNPYRLRQHNASVHDKIPLARNKICDICGRGFSANKILINHRRTHTGERPYQCEFCSAAFAQKYAMKTHMKTQHGASKMNKV